MTTTTEAVPTLINGRWTLNLPPHRANRQEWVTGWERERLDAMHTVIKPGDVVFDVGAEQGDLSALYGSWGARLVLFEPSPEIWPNIRYTWDANQLPAPLGCFVGFAANETNLAPVDVEPVFTEPDKDGWPACAYGPLVAENAFRNVNERFHDTPQIKLDHYLATGACPDVITMDVEGAELEVLRGAYRVLRYVRPTVFVSIHPEFMHHNWGYEAEHLHKYMAKVGYTGTHLATDHEQHFVFEPS